MPEDAYERRFLMLANTHAGDRGGRYGGRPFVGHHPIERVLTRQTAVAAGPPAALGGSLSMSSNVPKPVLMNDGTYRYDDGQSSPRPTLPGAEGETQAAGGTSTHISNRLSAGLS